MALDSCSLLLNPLNSLTHTVTGRSVACGLRGVERGITGTRIMAAPSGPRGGGAQSAFHRLLHFRPDSSAAHEKPALLLVAPISGHHATLLRETAKGSGKFSSAEGIRAMTLDVILRGSAWRNPLPSAALLFRQRVPSCEERAHVIAVLQLYRR